MKRVMSVAICVVMIFISGVSVVAATPLKEFKVKLVDKNSIAIQNANVTISPAKSPKDDEYRYFTTDANGEFRVSSKDLAISVGEYDVAINMPTVNKYKTETVKYKFTAENTKKIVTIKFGLVNQNDALFKAKKRTDIYLHNSKDGVVRNMKVQLIPTFDVPQTASLYGYDPYTPFAYTNSDGRVTFASMFSGEYNVEYSWLGGKSSGGKIAINSETDISTFTLRFDETLLNKK